PNCKNRTFFHYISIRVWFTLFFIPVIPYKNLHAYVCRVCSWGFPIKSQAERLEAMRRVEVTKQWAGKQLTDEQYREALVTAAAAPQTEPRMAPQQIAGPAPAGSDPPAPSDAPPPPFG